VDEQVFPKLVGKSTAKEELSLIEPTLVSGGFSAPLCSTIGDFDPQMSRRLT
jgi:hypothetical protein